MVANSPIAYYDSIRFGSEFLPYSFIENFCSSSDVLIQSDLVSPVILKPSDTVRINLKFNYQNNSLRDLEANRDYVSRVVYSFFQYGEWVEMQTTDIVIKNEMIGSSDTFSLLITTPAKPGQYDFYLSVGTGWLPPAINREKISFIVE